MDSEKIRKKFIHYFEKKKHHFVDSSSLWPQDDPSVLLTTAGMQQFKPYFMGGKDPVKDFGSKRLVSVQRCFRTSDIESVGDATHATFFEMLGNFSIGDYFKSEAIEYAWEFISHEMGIPADRLWATYFEGNTDVGADHEAVSLWKKYLPAEKIIGYGRSDNWWGPAGSSGPCGPCSELHYDFTKQPCAKKEKCLPNCECGRFMEIWNLVFTEYHQNERKKLKPLPKKNIDTGMGLERLALILQRKNNVFDTDLYSPLLHIIKHDANFGCINAYEDTVRSRIVADHIKAAVHLLSDGVTFSNKEQGYVLRRVFRRALDQYQHPHFALEPLVNRIIELYKSHNPLLQSRHNRILESVHMEIENYSKVLQSDISEIIQKIKNLPKKSNADVQGPSSRSLTAQEAFTLFSTYGLSTERLKREGFVFDEEKFLQEVENHQKISRAGAEKKFGGHGLNSTELSEDQKKIMTRYHTATHLLHQALRTVLGDTVRQEGSDITPERLRFDFSYGSKLTDEQKKAIEDLVNQKIKENLLVTSQEMPYDEAIASGALAFFKEKYPNSVTVYSINGFSKEVCGGPHVSATGEIGNFSVISEKSSSAGIRRIKATIK